jgi:hypothetical protein
MIHIILKTKAFRRITVLTIIPVFLQGLLSGQASDQRLYPFTYEYKPVSESPSRINDSTEVILIVTKTGKYALVPVTMENGKPLLYSYKMGTFMGKDQQLAVDQGDFPALAKTGLHSEDQIDNKKTITGIPINVINCTARPDAYSTTGFIAEDEDVLSVLKNDNRTVRKLGLTHPQLAKPVFHVWNLLLKEYELGNWGRFYDNVKHIYYNKNLLNFQASGSKGWQISIFFDEIQGRHNIHIDRSLTADEENYLDKKYAHLASGEMEAMKYKLTNLDFSEMLPYYIMRYGFYEGHTEYRCDPISIAFIFGLQSIEEIDKNTGGQLYNFLMDHFISQ